MAHSPTTSDEEAPETKRLDVFHLYRGDRTEERRAAVAERIRYALRDGNHEVTSAQFWAAYDHAGVDWACSLEETWQRWNRSPMTPYDAPIHHNEIRSLEVGDVVLLGGEAFVCHPFGWGRAEHLDAVVAQAAAEARAEADG